MFVAVFVFLAVSPMFAAVAEQSAAPGLTADQTSALSLIKESSILGTVSFLASDEMAGRDTPSVELQIASAFVAARFRGAGLEPLGSEGSYYQTNNFLMVQSPETPPELTVSADGRKLNGTTLSGDQTGIDIESTVVSSDELNGDTAARIVMMDAPKLPPGTEMKPDRALAALGRSVSKITEQGCRVVLLNCEPANVLWDVAEMVQKQPVALAEVLQPKCCIVLIQNGAEIIGQSIRVRCEAQQVIRSPVCNVVGLLRGSDPVLQHQAIIVSAHLDHIGTLTRGNDLINNGADDNASGVTAILSLADAFCGLQQRPRRSIIFTTFWGEEKGLRGSKAFVANPVWPLKDLVANVNLEMLGRPEKDAEGQIWMTGWRHSNLGELMNSGAQRIGVKIFDRKDVGEMLYTRSDNHAFVQAGVVGHSFSAGSLHSDYHQPSDEWQKLNIAHMKKVIQGLFAGILLIADSDVSITTP